MRFPRLLTALASLPLLAHAANKSKFVDLANQSKDGIITLNSALYEELLAPEATTDGKKGRDYAVAVVLTALPVPMNCAPCRTFDPIFKQEAASWKRLPKDQREDMFFAVLDFADGQQIFQKVSYVVCGRGCVLMLSRPQLGLQTAPNLQFHSPTVGSNKAQRQGQIAYDFGKKLVLTYYVKTFANPPLQRFRTEQPPQLDHLPRTPQIRNLQTLQPNPLRGRTHGHRLCPRHRPPQLPIPCSALRLAVPLGCGVYRRDLGVYQWTYVEPD